MAWSFDEVNDDVQFTDDAALTLPDGDWTIGGWIKLDDNVGTLYQYFLSWGAYAAHPSINWFFREHSLGGGPDDRLSVYIYDADGDGGSFTSTSTPGTSTAWQHLLLQRSGTTITQYIDGVADGTLTDAAFGGVNVAGNLFFGSRSDQNASRRLGGDMAEWGKWDRALTADERTILVSGYSPLFIPDLEWYAPMIKTYRELIVPLTVTNDGSTTGTHPTITYPPAFNVFGGVVLRG